MTVQNTALWDYCKNQLKQELPDQQFVTWIQPLQLEVAEASKSESEHLYLIAPNRFIKTHVDKNFKNRIETLADQFSPNSLSIELLDASNIQKVQTTEPVQTISKNSATPINSNFDRDNSFLSEPGSNTSNIDTQPDTGIFGGSDNFDVKLDLDNDFSSQAPSANLSSHEAFESNVDSELTFNSFVEGKSNQLAKAAAIQVSENPGGSYNPLFLYGASGLGKTHLMHAVGNELLKRNSKAKVVYLHSERFVANMVKALQQNKINEFKRYYRSVDALLIDDIQFFAGKERSQEEFFHTFNSLIEGGQQIILTCDRYPREIKGLEERLKSRFSWGLSVAVEPPELETRVAILMQKARQQNMSMSEDAAFFIARRLRSNVRELEGALKRVIAQAHFKNRPIDIELIKESLKDLLSMQDRLVSIDNIQKTVAEYYKIKVSDLHSKRRNRSVARPRQVAMSLSKELTSHSLPEIGDAFGGRDHTTVLHACRKIEELKESNTDIEEDLKNLLRILTA